ncbi:MAG: response regulator [Oscillochloridaceae bacterium umkhey_bin13]
MTYRLMVVAAADAALRGLVGQLGAEVQVQFCESANDALWEVRGNPPEALLAEVELSGMTGLELAEILPNFEVPTKIVLYSATNEAARADAEAVGVFRFLSGALSADDLRTALNAAAAAANMAAVEAAAAEAAAKAAAEAEAAAAAEAAAKAAAEAAAAKAAAKAARIVSPAPTRPEPPRQPPPAPAPSASPERRDFTPARVTLPTRAEREAEAAAAAAQPPAAPAAPAARGGLAARSKAVAASRPAPAVPVAAPPAADKDDGASAWRSGTGNLVVTEQNISAIRAVMGQLAQDLGTQSVMLTDRAGMVLVEVGQASNLPMMIVLPLLSTGFSTTGEVARQLREEDATSVYIHEGLGIDLYCFDVMQRFLLVLVFNKKVASSKIGAVWINAKRAIRELRDALSR